VAVSYVGKQRYTEEEWDVAYKRRVVSVAVSRKKKVAVDAIKSIEKGQFPISFFGVRNAI